MVGSKRFKRSRSTFVHDHLKSSVVVQNPLSTQKSPIRFSAVAHGPQHPYSFYHQSCRAEAAPTCPSAWRCSCRRCSYWPPRVLWSRTGCSSMVQEAKPYAYRTLIEPLGIGRWSHGNCSAAARGNLETIRNHGNFKIGSVPARGTPDFAILHKKRLVNGSI